MPIAAGAAIMGAAGIGSALIGASSAKKAGRAAAAGAARSEAFQREMLGQSVADFDPYRDAGQTGLERFLALSGAGGADAQTAEIAALEQSPMYQALMQQGENAILQNASATGGIRGGNTQAALMTHRPNFLNQLIQQQLSTYGGLTNMGMNATGNLNQLRQGYGSNISGAMTGAANAKAAGIMGTGNAWQGAMQGIGQIGSAIMGAGLMGGSFGGGGGFTPPPAPSIGAVAAPYIPRELGYTPQPMMTRG